MIRKIYARHLLSKGLIAKALVVSDYRDIKILSQAGMHLSVLKSKHIYFKEFLLAYIHTFQFEKAFNILQKEKKFSKEKNIIGQLALANPKELLTLYSIKELSPDIAFYCLLMTKGSQEAYAQVNKSNVSLILQYLAAKLDNTSEASDIFKRFWNSYQLPEVRVLYNETNCEQLSFSLPCLSPPYKHKELISVVLCVYNQQTLLPNAVHSLLNQTWENLEIIVVNDGSNDKTLEVAYKLAKQNSKIKVVNIVNNQGLMKAKNVGMQHCRGEFITMHDADDWSHPLKIEKQVIPLLENKNLQASCSYLLRMDNKRFLPFSRNISSYITLNPSSLMFRKSVLKKIGNFLSGGLGYDCEYIERIKTTFSPKAVSRIKLPLSIALHRSNSISNQFRTQDTIHRRIEDWEKWRKLHVTAIQNRQSLYFKDTIL